MAFGTFCESMRVDDDGKSQMEKRDSRVKGYVLLLTLPSSKGDQRVTCRKQIIFLVVKNILIRILEY